MMLEKIQFRPDQVNIHKLLENKYICVGRWRSHDQHNRLHLSPVYRQLQNLALVSFAWLSIVVKQSLSTVIPWRVVQI